MILSKVLRSIFHRLIQRQIIQHSALLLVVSGGIPLLSVTTVCMVLPNDVDLKQLEVTEITELCTLNHCTRKTVSRQQV
jgi:hypothetical protein